MVTQHFSLVQPMTVTENVILGRASGARLDLAAARRIGAKRPPSASASPCARMRSVQDLSVGEQQRVEIVKALARDCRVLILDEPTAVLVPQEVDGPLRDAASPHRRWPQRRLHQPQAGRGPRHQRPGQRDAPGAAWSAPRPATPTSASWRA